MKHIKNILSVAALAAAMNCNLNLHAAPMPTAFTYQGTLNNGTAPANGLYDFEFRLTDAPSNSAPVASQAHSAVAVSNGVFTALPDFGSGYFNGDPRWLEIAVRTTGSGSNFTTLLPRTPLTPTPYALVAERARTADVATSATGLALPLAMSASHPNPLLQVANGSGPALWAETTNAAAVVAVNYGDGNALFAANAGGGPAAVILGGNVGIGTQTPGEQLSVNGVIESKQGGVKFPDGTIQFTAGQTSAPPPQVWSLNGSSDTYRASGQVGIGTIAPEGILHLTEPVDQPLRLRMQTSRLTAGAMQKPSQFPSGARVALSGQPWSNPHHALASDDQRSVVNLSGSEGGLDFTASQNLILTNFGFILPTNAVIAKIEVEVNAQGTASAPECYPLTFIHAALTKGTNVGSSTLATPYLDSQDVTNSLQATLGGWGLNLTPAAVNEPDFGVQIAADLEFWFVGFNGVWYRVDADGTGTVALDSIAVVVHYYEVDSVLAPTDFVLGVPGDTQTLRLMPGADFTNTSGLYLSTNGAVGIGAEPGFFIPLHPAIPANLQLDVNGTARVHGDLHCTGSIHNSGGILGLSTRRYKNEIQPLHNALELVQKLTGVSYRWDADHGGKPDIGFIAEEVGQVVPQIVEYEPDGKNALGLKYDRINALTVEAIKELNAALREKDAQLRVLADEVKALKESLGRR